jgi:hypothetical protein
LNFKQGYIIIGNCKKGRLKLFLGRFNVSDGNRLDSWKEISKYINRGIRTCQRWEKELGLPVYRIDKISISSRVFAYKSEIDHWFKEKT